MSLQTAIGLIRNELPLLVWSEVEAKLSAAENGSTISATGFSIQHVSDPDNFRLILERHFNSIEAKSNEGLRNWHRERLKFVNEAFAEASAGKLWQAYCMVDTRRLFVRKKRKRMWFLIDVGRTKVLKHLDPRALFED